MGAVSLLFADHYDDGTIKEFIEDHVEQLRRAYGPPLCNRAADMRAGLKALKHVLKSDSPELAHIGTHEEAVRYLAERCKYFGQDTPKGQTSTGKGGRPYFSTFMNGGRYLDDPEAWGVVQPKKQTRNAVDWREPMEHHWLNWRRYFATKSPDRSDELLAMTDEQTEALVSMEEFFKQVMAEGRKADPEIHRRRWEKWQRQAFAAGKWIAPPFEKAIEQAQRWAENRRAEIKGSRPAHQQKEQA